MMLRGAVNARKAVMVLKGAKKLPTTLNPVKKTYLLLSPLSLLFFSSFFESKTLHVLDYIISLGQSSRAQSQNFCFPIVFIIRFFDGGRCSPR